MRGLSRAFASPLLVSPDTLFRNFSAEPNISQGRGEAQLIEMIKEAGDGQRPCLTVLEAKSRLGCRRVPFEL